MIRLYENQKKAKKIHLCHKARQRRILSFILLTFSLLPAIAMHVPSSVKTTIIAALLSDVIPTATLFISLFSSSVIIFFCFCGWYASIPACEKNILFVQFVLALF
ncbi:MAG: hypothetical protein IKJ81_06850 [Bacteroidales bacterium]|nr:hypothetical protein [Bacteroidales bacterium]